LIGSKKLIHSKVAFIIALQFFVFSCKERTSSEIKDKDQSNSQSFIKVQNLLNTHKGDITSALSKIHNILGSGFTIVHKSEGTQGDTRVVYFGASGDVVLTVGPSSSEIHGVRRVSKIRDSPKFEPFSYSYDSASNGFKFTNNPSECLGCHGPDQFHFIWDDYSNWPDFLGEDDDEYASGRSDIKQYNKVRSFLEENNFGYIFKSQKKSSNVFPYNNISNSWQARPNARFSSILEAYSHDQAYNALVENRNIDKATFLVLYGSIFDCNNLMKIFPDTKDVGSAKVSKFINNQGLSLNEMMFHLIGLKQNELIVRERTTSLHRKSRHKGQNLFYIGGAGFDRQLTFLDINLYRYWHYFLSNTKAIHPSNPDVLKLVRQISELSFYNSGEQTLESSGIDLKDVDKNYFSSFENMRPAREEWYRNFPGPYHDQSFNKDYAIYRFKSEFTTMCKLLTNWGDTIL